MTSQSLITPLENQRIDRLNELFREILPANRFQADRFGSECQVASTADFVSLPFLTKSQLVDDSAANPPFGTNLTYEPAKYTRYHQTSGTTGSPLRILDTEKTWDWWGRCWLEVFRAANVTAADRLFFAFSFAPSIGFWSSYRAGEMLGAMLIPSGGASTEQRLRMIVDLSATVLLCTPSYALRLAEVAENRGVPIRESSIQTLIHAGEPGASIPHTRARLEEAWNARIVDHAGATEIGAWGIGTLEGDGLYVNEDEFIAEVVDQESGKPVAPGQQGELVITNLGRGAWPVIRYRTGDIVNAVREVSADGSTRLRLLGGLLGRTDDMVTIRGVNIFPSAIENVVRQAAGTAEYRVTATRRHHLDDLEIEVEGDSNVCPRIAGLIRERMGIRVSVRAVLAGSLPRWEAKNKRFVDAR